MSSSQIQTFMDPFPHFFFLQNQSGGTLCLNSFQKKEIQFTLICL